MKTVGLVGLGAIGAHVVDHWHDVDGEYCLKSVLARPAQVQEQRRASLLGAVVYVDRNAFLREPTDIVIEAAGHAAVRDLGPDLLRQGRTLYLLSVGITADEAFITLLRDAAHAGGGRILIPAGALAGFDGVMALARHRQAKVHYTSRKPPLAWQGTPAEEVCDLLSVTEPTTIFEGSAREAAHCYPKNANLAAAVALAGVGLDQTTITLIADPQIQQNVGIVEAESDLGKLTVRVSGDAAHNNPKTSAIVGASILSALSNQASDIQFI